MGWFSKKPPTATLEEIVKIVVTDTDAYIDSAGESVAELALFEKLPTARSIWRDKALKTCYEISQLKQVDQQAIASRKAMLEAIDEKFLWQQVANEKFDDEAREGILDALVRDSAWDISEDDPQRYAKKKEVWGSYLAIGHANALAYSELCKHFEDADRVHTIMELYIKSAKLFYEHFVEAALQQELEGNADSVNVFSVQLSNKSHELLKKDILEAK